MIIDRYRCKKSFQLPNGDWESHEMRIKLSDTDTVENARQLAKENIDECFRRNNPDYTPPISYFAELPTIQVEHYK